MRCVCAGMADTATCICEMKCARSQHTYISSTHTLALLTLLVGLYLTTFSSQDYNLVRAGFRIRKLLSGEVSTKPKLRARVAYCAVASGIYYQVTEFKCGQPRWIYSQHRGVSLSEGAEFHETFQRYRHRQQWQSRQQWQQ